MRIPVNRYQRLTGDIVQPHDDAAPSQPVGMASGRWGALAAYGARQANGSKKLYGYRGNSFVAVVEFGDKVKAKSLLAGGQSGNIIKKTLRPALKTNIQLPPRAKLRATNSSHGRIAQYKHLIMTKRIALYPGTFDPMTLGHLDIMKRASRLCDKLIIGVAVNEAKKPLFSIDERVEMVEHVVAPFRDRIEVNVMPFEGLLIHFVESCGASMIVRGLRAVSDFEYEFQMAGMNDRLNPDIETVFLMSDPEYQTIASRLVKEIARLGGDVAQFVTPEVDGRLKDKYK